MTGPLLHVDELTVRFPVRGGHGELTAVDRVSLDVGEAEIVGLVGESGCGKSTLARAIVGLERPVSGRVLFGGRELTGLRGRALRAARRPIQFIFQDPESSLSPRHTAGESIDEPLRLSGMTDRSERRRRVGELLDLVGLASQHADRYPRALSGGQRQRVGIARALALEPRLLLCDEPVSALDVSIRAQVMNVFLDLRRELGVACLFIAHDLAVVRQACDRVAVMYLGRIVELARSAALYAAPGHPYSHALLSAIPSADPDVERARKRIVLAGEVPSPVDPPTGCAFHPRCPIAERRCQHDPPALTAAEVDRSVACHFPGRSRVALGYGGSAACGRSR